MGFSVSGFVASGSGVGVELTHFFDVADHVVPLAQALQAPLIVAGFVVGHLHTAVAAESVQEAPVGQPPLLTAHAFVTSGTSGTSGSSTGLAVQLLPVPTNPSLHSQMG